MALTDLAEMAVQAAIRKDKSPHNHRIATMIAQLRTAGYPTFADVIIAWWSKVRKDYLAQLQVLEEEVRRITSQS